MERLARALMSAGIDTFFAQWEIRAGDSLRQRIDQGISDCTHFVVLLTPASIRKPWVNAELDAGFVARLADELRLIPLRFGLSASELPPLLRGLRSPSLDDFESTVGELISDILGVTERPPVGPTPAFALSSLPREAGLSPLAGQIAVLLVRSSSKARYGDPQLSAKEVRTLTGVSDDDIAEAVDELESCGWIEPLRAGGTGKLGFVALMPRKELFADLDGLLMPWNPLDDAKIVAAEILNTPGESMVIPVLDQRLGWGPRRMNPAITFIVKHDAMDHSNSSDPDYVYYSLRRNTATRRFLRE